LTSETTTADRKTKHVCAYARGRTGMVGAVDPHIRRARWRNGLSMRVVHRSRGSNTCESEDRVPFSSSSCSRIVN